MTVPRRRMESVPLHRVRVTGGFWAERQRVNREATLPYEYEQCRRTGRLDAWKLQWKPGDPNPPHKFWDSDVAKWIEAAAYSLATHPDPALKRRLDRLIVRIEKAQQPDGYLNTHFIAVEPDKRWTNLRDDHELYCAGHLIEAAVAHHQATGERRLLDVLCRYADLICRTFGPGPGQKRGYPGHEEIELALVKLYRCTGQGRYLAQAKFFVDERGRRPHYFDLEAEARGEDPDAEWYRQRYGPVRYLAHQAHVPVREQTEAVGHAVRAMYLYSGMADVAAETDDADLFAACRRLWRSVVERKMYVTGGVGSSAQGERFTGDYDLPNETAYAETCAAIGLVFFAHRMLEIEADGAYADVMERALYNGALGGVSLDGTRFFYTNRLAVYPPVLAPDDPRNGLERQPWFGCACCPPNIARLIASFGRYAVSQSSDAAWVHLFFHGDADLDIGGMRVRLSIESDYPWEGRVVLRVEPESTRRFTLAVRVPGWAREARVRVNDERVAPLVRRGYAFLRRAWQAGDRVRLDLPMPVERIEAHPEVRQDAGRVALQRGPLVYCFEEADNGKGLHALMLPDRSRPTAHFNPDLLGGVTTITAPALRPDSRSWRGPLYRPKGCRWLESPVVAIPYFARANRRPGEMIVWVNGR